MTENCAEVIAGDPLEDTIVVLILLSKKMIM